eukprot:COSAG02_NODE_1998_length_10148_cov_30.517663_2_plen_48_part_00
MMIVTYLLRIINMVYFGNTMDSLGILTAACIISEWRLTTDDSQIESS